MRDVVTALFSTKDFTRCDEILCNKLNFYSNSSGQSFEKMIY